MASRMPQNSFGGGADHEVLFLLFQAAASTGYTLPGLDVQDAWPPME